MRRGLEKETWASLGKVGTVIGLCAFFFGIGTFADLRDRFAPLPDVPAQFAESYQKTYVEQADNACLSNAANGALPDSITYSWMTSILTARRQMAQKWVAVMPFKTDSWDQDAWTRDVPSTIADFLAANAFWAATAEDLKAKDKAGYNTNLGMFITATAEAQRAATRLGLKRCTFGWPTPPPWQ